MKYKVEPGKCPSGAILDAETGEMLGWFRNISHAIYLCDCQEKIVKAAEEIQRLRAENKSLADDKQEYINLLAGRPKIKR